MMSKHILLLALIVAINIRASTSFFLPKDILKHHTAANVRVPSASHKKTSPKIGQPLQKVANIPRGGSLKMSPSSIASMITSNLQAGPYGVLALSAVTWSVVLPLTLYKKVYGIGVAYGFSVMAAGYTLLQIMSASSSQSAILMAQACIFYGARLGGYLLLRDILRDYQSTIKNGSITSRISFSGSLALFYAFLTTPVLYALRSNAATTNLCMGGAYLACFGACLEAVADVHKLIVKQSNIGVEGFVGPTTWTYRLCRHPNYLGEILFWIGLFVGGVSSFGKSVPAWIGSGFGLLGIVSIMTKAAGGLEERQQSKYGGQEKFETWKEKVKYSLIPFIQ